MKIMMIKSDDRPVFGVQFQTNKFILAPHIQIENIWEVGYKLIEISLSNNPEYRNIAITFLNVTFKIVFIFIKDLI